MRSRTIGYKIDERFWKRFVGSIYKWEVVDNIELMISERSEMLKQEKEKRESVASFGKVWRLLSLFKDQIEFILSIILVKIVIRRKARRGRIFRKKFRMRRLSIFRRRKGDNRLP